jgi:glycosyltransferase involved in cell wall biosynthesis
MFGAPRYYAVSESAHRNWIRFARIPAYRVRTIYNCINDGFFAASRDRNRLGAELGIPEDSRIVLFVGRLNMVKGIDTIYEALKGILASENLFLLYAGGEEDAESFFPDGQGIADRIRSLSVEDKVDRRILFLGHRQDVPRIMASSDLLVHPARSEAYGLVLVEAMAAGLPLVASDVGGIPEVLAGTESILIQPEDAESLRQAVMETLARTAQFSAKAAETGRKRAQEFRMSRRIDAMINLFEDVLERKF